MIILTLLNNVHAATGDEYFQSLLNALVPAPAAQQTQGSTVEGLIAQIDALAGQGEAPAIQARRAALEQQLAELLDADPQAASIPARESNSVIARASALAARTDAPGDIRNQASALGARTSTLGAQTSTLGAQLSGLRAELGGLTPSTPEDEEALQQLLDQFAGITGLLQGVQGQLGNLTGNRQ